MTGDLFTFDAPDAACSHFFKIEFDGGNGCNNPRQGFGKGYGSYRVNDGEVIRVDHGRPMSNNAAEIHTLIAAIKSITTPRTETVLEIRGDSKIALLRVKKAPKQFYKGKQSSAEFLSACESLRNLCAEFKSVETRWQPRAKSVAAFGH